MTVFFWIDATAILLLVLFALLIQVPLHLLVPAGPIRGYDTYRISELIIGLNKVDSLLK